MPPVFSAQWVSQDHREVELRLDISIMLILVLAMVLMLSSCCLRPLCVAGMHVVVVGGGMSGRCVGSGVQGRAMNADCVSHVLTLQSPSKGTP